MAIYLTNKKDIERLKQDYLLTFLVEDKIKDALNNFSNETGFGDQYIGLIFKDDVEYGWGDVYEALMKEDKEKQVLIYFYYPVEPDDTYFYLTYDELYDSLKSLINKQFWSDIELLKILETVKTSFGI